MPTLKYRISARVQNGQAEVLVRFNGTKVFCQRAKTRIIVPVSAWNDQVGELSVPNRPTPETVALRQMQRKLDALTDTIYAAWWRDRYDAQEGWLQSVVDAFHAIPTAREQKRMRMPDLVMESAAAKDLVTRSVDQYRVLATALERFEAATRRPLYADTFTAADVEAFVQWYTNEGGVIRSRNTMAAKLKKLSAVCHYAVAKGYMESAPFGEGKYKIQGEVYGDPVYLTLAERNRLYQCTGLSGYLAVQRDIFIFQCHIGCRVSDLMELTNDNVTEDGFLQYIQHKLRKSKPIVVRVPLSDTALEIIERYKNQQPNGRLLPFINSTYYNRAIHDMLRLAGLKRIVMVQDPTTLQTVPKQLWQVGSSHMARRTFMANMFKETKSERITSAFTGHVNGSRAFSRYTQVDDDMKLEVLKHMHEIK